MDRHMQGKHVFQPQTGTVIDLESFIAEDHFLRRVDRVLEMSFVRDVTAACYAAGLGRYSIDPEVFFRMLLAAYLYNITSDRRLCEEVRYHLAYRWFCRLSLEDDIPDHSSLSRIRDRYGEEIFETVFPRPPLRGGMLSSPTPNPQVRLAFDGAAIRLESK